MKTNSNNLYKQIADRAYQMRTQGKTWADITATLNVEDTK
jgi:hypothetical protein